MYRLPLIALPDFYPRSPCGERQALGLLGWLRVLISIHALLAESDMSEVLIVTVAIGISIHALLAESRSEERRGGKECV